MQNDQAIALQEAVSELAARVDRLQQIVEQQGHQLLNPPQTGQSPTIPHPAKPEPYVDLSAAAMKAPQNTAAFDVNHRPTPGRITRLHPGVSPDQEARARAEADKHSGDE